MEVCKSVATLLLGLLLIWGAGPATATAQEDPGFHRFELDEQQLLDISLEDFQEFRQLLWSVSRHMERDRPVEPYRGELSQWIEHFFNMGVVAFAHASIGSGHPCFFGGWISVTNRRGRCQVPWRARRASMQGIRDAFQDDEGAIAPRTYELSCVGDSKVQDMLDHHQENRGRRLGNNDLFRCNPDFFYKSDQPPFENGFCVPENRNRGYIEISKKCGEMAEASGNLEAHLEMLREDDEARRRFVRSFDLALDYCQERTGEIQDMQDRYELNTDLGRRLTAATSDLPSAHRDLIETCDALIYRAWQINQGLDEAGAPHLTMASICTDCDDPAPRGPAADLVAAAVGSPPAEDRSDSPAYDPEQGDTGGEAPLAAGDDDPEAGAAGSGAPPAGSRWTDLDGWQHFGFAQTSYQNSCRGHLEANAQTGRTPRGGEGNELVRISCDGSGPFCGEAQPDRVTMTIQNGTRRHQCGITRVARDYMDYLNSDFAECIQAGVDAHFGASTQAITGLHAVTWGAHYNPHSSRKGSGSNHRRGRAIDITRVDIELADGTQSLFHFGGRAGVRRNPRFQEAFLRCHQHKVIEYWIKETNGNRQKIEACLRPARLAPITSCSLSGTGDSLVFGGCDESSRIGDLGPGFTIRTRSGHGSHVNLAWPTCPLESYYRF